MQKIKFLIKSFIIIAVVSPLFLTNSFAAGAGKTSTMEAPILSVLEVSKSGVGLAWQLGSGKEDGFEIERSTSGTNFTGLAKGWERSSYNPKIMYFVDAYSLISQTKYYYRVRVFKKNGQFSPYSNIVTATTS